MPDTLDGLQLILGTDKRNPAFCLYTDATAQALHVYYGLELLEVVPNDRASPAFRLLAARLYNAGLRVATLVALFDLDPKTLRTWGRALRSGDRDWLARVLAGRWGRRKLTPALESYVRQRWPLLRAQGVRDYRQRLRAELERVFGVTVAGETLRPLLRQLRAAARSGPTANPGAVPAEAGVAANPLATETHPARATEVPAPPVPDATHEPPTLSTPRLPLEFTALAEPPSAGAPTPGPAVALPAAPAAPSPAVPSATPPGSAEVTGVSAPLPASVLPPARQSLPSWEDWSVGQTVWCEHAGVLLFADALRTVSAAVTPPQPWLRQALGSVLAGALNVEPTKHLNAADLAALLGPQVPGLGAQRRQLKALAAGPTAAALLRWNAHRPADVER